MKFPKLKTKTTKIQGLKIINLELHHDNRGWYKENWNKHKLPIEMSDQIWIQNNISFTNKKGTIRGIHVEPWDKYVSVVTGKIFGLWIDLRKDSPTFGEVESHEIDANLAVFVPRGVGNSFQTLEDNTTFTYLINGSFSEKDRHKYISMNVKDEKVIKKWPISPNNPDIIISDNDKKNPFFKNIKPMSKKKILVIGCNGQLGSEVYEYAKKHKIEHDFIFSDVGESKHMSMKFDFTDENEYQKIDWTDVETIINCAAYTNVDKAETEIEQCWKLNAYSLNLLVKYASKHNIKIVHVSTDYIFNGEREIHYEDELPSPLNVYGHSKAAGDLIVSSYKKHYIIRTSWVIGNGKNFVKTMFNLFKDKQRRLNIVNDQFGRLTFCSTLVDGIFHLLNRQCDYGTYNLTNSGDVVCWGEIAKYIAKLVKFNVKNITLMSTKEYRQINDVVALRPKNSVMSLNKIQTTGLKIINWKLKVKEYIKTL